MNRFYQNLCRKFNLGCLLTSGCRTYKTTHYSIRDRKNDPRWKGINLEREYDDVDVLIVGGGPAGLSAAIKLAQLSKDNDKNLRICVIEKSSEFGGHSLSGACLEPTALNELIPNWQTFDDNPVKTKVEYDKMNFLTKSSSINIPIPPWFPVTNKGNYLCSLGRLVKWLSLRAEELGVELYNGIGGSEVLYDNSGSVIGIGTADCGIAKDGSPKDNFERGLGLRAKFTLFAEGCHGSLTKDVIKKFNLRKDCSPQTYGLGFKELWLVDPKMHKPGMLEHNIGFPMDMHTYGGSFIYHLDDGPMVSLGLIISLGYKNPNMNLFQEFQLLKTHPKLKKLLTGGERIGYGARALNEGGYQAIPKLIFPGGCLIGCSAGFVNNVKIKGIHTAMKSGMVSAEAIIDYFRKHETVENGVVLKSYEESMNKSWVMEELRFCRNVKPAFSEKLGLFGMLGYSGVVLPILRGKESFTLKHNTPDNETLMPASLCRPKVYPKPDNKITFDLLSSVALTNTNHDHDEPSHLTLLDDDVPQSINLELYDGPEQRYCPAGVYEFIDTEDGKKTLQINAQNCIHCKTCDIKDPSQNINWVVPHNGGGPGYSSM